MKILLTGGGTGGHFYPLIAVAHALRDAQDQERIVSMSITLAGDAPFDAESLREDEIQFKQIPAGKARRYFSLKNISDSFKTTRGIISAMWWFTFSMPDVVFSKGGFDSFPVLVASRLYRIPVMIHETDSVPGVVNKWAGRFAKRIAISYQETAKYFDETKTALVGNPIRRTVLGGSKDEAFDVFNLESGIPAILVTGGSQGAQAINEVILSALPELVEKYQIIHSVGPVHGKNVPGEAAVVLAKSVHKKRYHPYLTLSASQLRSASYAADLIISRAGGSIFEIAAWKKPAILIPLKSSAQDHQRENAYNYARNGGAVVVEEPNLKPHLLMSEIERIINDKDRKKEMSDAAASFAKIDADRIIANELIKLGLHE